MKITQIYIRLNLSQDYIPRNPLINRKWYAVTCTNGVCGKIIDEKGDTYLVDLESIESTPRWEIKRIEVTL